MVMEFAVVLRKEVEWSTVVWREARLGSSPMGRGPSSALPLPSGIDIAIQFVTTLLSYGASMVIARHSRFDVVFGVVFDPLLVSPRLLQVAHVGVPM